MAGSSWPTFMEGLLTFVTSIRTTRTIWSTTVLLVRVWRSLAMHRREAQSYPRGRRKAPNTELSPKSWLSFQTNQPEDTFYKPDIIPFLKAYFHFWLPETPMCWINTLSEGQDQITEVFLKFKLAITLVFRGRKAHTQREKEWSR